MDLSVLTSDDIDDIIKSADSYGRRENADPNKILGIYACGIKAACQETPTSTAWAIKNIAKKYAEHGIMVTFEELNNDQSRKWDGISKHIWTAFASMISTSTQTIFTTIWSALRVRHGPYQTFLTKSIGSESDASWLLGNSYGKICSTPYLAEG